VAGGDDACELFTSITFTLDNITTERPSERSLPPRVSAPNLPVLGVTGQQLAPVQNSIEIVAYLDSFTYSLRCTA